MLKIFWQEGQTVFSPRAGLSVTPFSLPTSETDNDIVDVTKKAQSTSKAFIFGGASHEQGTLNDAYLMDFEGNCSKLEIDSQLPSPRYEHGTAFCNGYVFIFAGASSNQELRSDFWRFDIIDNRFKKIVATGQLLPRGRTIHSAFTAVPDLGKQGRLYMFGGGGLNHQPIEDSAFVWIFDVEKEAWIRLRFKENEAPEPRFGHCLVTIGRKLWLFGGLNATRDPLNDLWCFDVERNKWSKIELSKGSEVPRARCGFGAVAWRDRFLVVAGGIHAATPNVEVLSDIWLFDVVELKWIKLSAEFTKRLDHSLVMINDSKLASIAGMDLDSVNNDVHILDLKAAFTKNDMREVEQ